MATRQNYFSNFTEIYKDLTKLDIELSNLSTKSSKIVDKQYIEKILIEKIDKNLENITSRLKEYKKLSSDYKKLSGSKKNKKNPEKDKIDGIKTIMINEVNNYNMNKLNIIVNKLQLEAILKTIYSNDSSLKMPKNKYLVEITRTAIKIRKAMMNEDPNLEKYFTVDFILKQVPKIEGMIFKLDKIRDTYSDNLLNNIDLYKENVNNVNSENNANNANNINNDNNENNANNVNNSNNSNSVNANNGNNLTDNVREKRLEFDAHLINIKNMLNELKKTLQNLVLLDDSLKIFDVSNYINIQDNNNIGKIIHSECDNKLLELINLFKKLPETHFNFITDKKKTQFLRLKIVHDKILNKISKIDKEYERRGLEFYNNNSTNLDNYKKKVRNYQKFIGIIDILENKILSTLSSLENSKNILLFKISKFQNISENSQLVNSNLRSINFDELQEIHKMTKLLTKYFMQYDELIDSINSIDLEIKTFAEQINIEFRLLIDFYSNFDNNESYIKKIVDDSDEFNLSLSNFKNLNNPQIVLEKRNILIENKVKLDILITNNLSNIEEKIVEIKSKQKQISNTILRQTRSILQNAELRRIQSSRKEEERLRRSRHNSKSTRSTTLQSSHVKQKKISESENSLPPARAAPIPTPLFGKKKQIFKTKKTIQTINTSNTSKPPARKPASRRDIEQYKPPAPTTIANLVNSASVNTSSKKGKKTVKILQDPVPKKPSKLNNLIDYGKSKLESYEQGIQENIYKNVPINTLIDQIHIRNLDEYVENWENIEHLKQILQLDNSNYYD